MTTPRRLFKVGRPIDVVRMNEYWNRVWIRLKETKNQGVDYASGQMHHTSAIVLAGNAINTPDGTISRWPYDSWVWQNPAALNDEFENSCYVPPGTYELRVLGRVGTARGIISWYVDDALVGTQDWYLSINSPKVNPQTLTDIAVGGGWVTVRGKATSKNASSSGYQIQLTKYALVKTGDL